MGRDVAIAGIRSRTVRVAGIGGRAIEIRTGGVVTPLSVPSRIRIEFLGGAI